MIKIGFDVSPLRSGHQFRGIGSYTGNLLKQLKQLPELEIVEFIQSEFPQIRHNVDLIHQPYFDLTNLTVNYEDFPIVPTIVTIHDVIPLQFPKHYPLGIKGKINLYWQKVSLNTVVNAVVTDSESSKENIAKYLSYPKNNIYVTYLAAGEEFKKITNSDLLERVSVKYSLPKNFAIYVGNVNWNKNILGIAQACIDSEIDLVLVGKSFEERDNLDHPELRSFKQFLGKYSNHPKIHILGYVEKEEIVPLLNLATVMLYPSFAEGFGLPILEAQACGLPVITSKISSMPEVGGKGAVYVDPYDNNEIVTAIKKITSDKKTSSGLIKLGFENTKLFNWEKTAIETKKVYEKVLGK